MVSRALSEPPGRIWCPPVLGFPAVGLHVACSVGGVSEVKNANVPIYPLPLGLLIHPAGT